jgi:hypothetical protein
MKRVLVLLLLLCGGVLAAQTLDEYLVLQCRMVGVSVDMVCAILEQENDTLKSDAVHVNLDQSRDLGLFQLNDRYLYTDFLPRYWHFEEQFQWDNSYHSAYVAVRHIRWLWDQCPVGVPSQSKAFQVALMYNCGIGAVGRGEVPMRSVAYAMRVVRAVWGD